MRTMMSVAQEFACSWPVHGLADVSVSGILLHSVTTFQDQDQIPKKPVNPTGHCDSTPTRRKAAPEEAQDEPPTQATQNAKAHRHAHRHTNSRRRQHCQAV
jgi:hypothetical protein